MALLAALAWVSGFAGCSSNGNPLAFEGIKLENGEVVYCFREVDPLPFLIGNVRVLNEMRPEENPTAPRYVRLPESSMWDLAPVGSPVTMSGANPSGSGSSTYVQLPEGGDVEWQLRATLQYQFQLQGASLRHGYDKLRFDVYEGVPSTYDETVERYLGALYLGIRIEEKPPQTGLQHLDFILGQIAPNLPNLRPGATWADLTGQLICHSNGVLQEVPDAESEITHFGVFYAPLDQTGVDNLANMFPAGQGSYGYTSLAQSQLPLVTGNYTFAFQVRQAPLDLSDTMKQLQLGFVWDSDDDPSNNFMADPSFPKDLFDNTDLWTYATYDFSNKFQLSVTYAASGSFTNLSSAARLINYEEVTLLAIPSDELDYFTAVQGLAAPFLPPYRATFFKHFGDYGLNPPNVFKVDTAPTVDLPLAQPLGGSN